MKILFTAEGQEWGSLMDPRLGRAEFLLLYDEASDKLTAFPNGEAASMQHAGHYTAKKILELNPDIIITGNGPGGRAYDVLADSGISIYIGAEGMPVATAYDAHKAGKLEKF